MQVVADAGVMLQIGFNRRFDRNFAKARDYIREGWRGPCDQDHLARSDPAGHGLFHCSRRRALFHHTDTTIHDFDMARFLNNAEVTKVYAMGSTLINKDKPEIAGDDTCVITLRFADNSLAVIDNSWEAVYGYDQRAEVLGTNEAVTVEMRSFSRATLNCREGVSGKRPRDRYGAAYAEEVHRFVLTVQNGTPVKASGMED